jgi:hypothetical protein
MSKVKLTKDEQEARDHLAGIISPEENITIEVQYAGSVSYSRVFRVTQGYGFGPEVQEITTWVGRAIGNRSRTTKTQKGIRQPQGGYCPALHIYEGLRHRLEQPNEQKFMQRI